MESLFANYASSDEEQEEAPTVKHGGSSSNPKAKPTSKSIEPNNPKISSFFSSLPQPKPTSSSSLFSSLPKPKPNSQTPTNINPFDPKPKKIVQFIPPINPNLLKSRDIDDDDEEDEKRRKSIKQSKSSSDSSFGSSFFSSIPAPKSSLGSTLGSGRRSIVEADVPALSSIGVDSVKRSSEVASESLGSYEGNNFGNYGSNSVGYDQPSAITVEPVVECNESYGGYGHYQNYVNYESSSSGTGNYGSYDGSLTAMSDPTMMYARENSVVVENVVSMPGMGKRRRKDAIPDDIVEVKQDELMKNRPKEDQAKLTGIAFGPSYQVLLVFQALVLQTEQALPSLISDCKGIIHFSIINSCLDVTHPAASSKGKPTKLHKRKHQIGSLYFDMRQKESELAERRSKGFLTKAETHAKYGW
ncbi:hypothetical protein GIB67_034727 [Kingdonia uniflora]|uniref:Proline-rich protein PRCC n=1 Tax=Kingdonia uniflora TaxID=39325 RepID=A0A7J7MLD1_9MAGN|nr:hypothetical protein GIB67_034727 [Kingdonia uniflora]